MATLSNEDRAAVWADVMRAGGSSLDPWRVTKQELRAAIDLADNTIVAAEDDPRGGKGVAEKRYSGVVSAYDAMPPATRLGLSGTQLDILMDRVLTLRRKRG